MEWIKLINQKPIGKVPASYGGHAGTFNADGYGGVFNFQEKNLQPVIITYDEESDNYTRIFDVEWLKITEENKPLQPGDFVCVHDVVNDKIQRGVDGYNAVVGVLTKFDPENIYCEIDGVSYDLASEGHSSVLQRIKHLR